MRSPGGGQPARCRTGQPRLGTAARVPAYNAAAALIWMAANAGAGGQTHQGVAYERAAAIEAICRQYAAAQTGMPADLMFDQCMSERHCRVSPGSPDYRCELPGPMTWHGGGY
jgi:hypothetical protein